MQSSLWIDRIGLFSCPPGKFPQTFTHCSRAHQHLGNITPANLT